MFGFKAKKQGNRKVEAVRPFRGQVPNKHIKPFVVATLVCILAVGIVAGHERYRDKVWFPITRISLANELQNVSQASLEQWVLKNVKQGFFNIDLNDIADNIEQISWVAQATLRRVWPDTVEIIVREHQAIAVWDEQTLISAEGVLFQVPSSADYKHLARVSGQVEDARELLLAYSQLEQLIAPYGLHVKALTSEKSGAMNVLFDTQLTAIFAYQDKDIQFNRFVALLETGYLALNSKQNTFNKQALKSIDLRYSNGFSIVWQEPQTYLLNHRNKKQTVLLVNGNQHV